jgi:hypothetical protein
MNGYDSEALIEDLDEAAEYDEDEPTEYAEDDEAAEFLPIPPFFPFPFGGTKSRAPGAGYYKAPPPPAFVTQAQLKSALERVQKDVRANSAAVKSLNSRVATVQSLQSRHTKELAKQNATNAKQAKAIAGVRAELKKSREMSLIMYLMTRPKTTASATNTDVEVGTDSGVYIPSGHKVVVAPEKDDSMILMLLLSGALGDLGGGGDNSMLMMLALNPGMFG